MPPSGSQQALKSFQASLVICVRPEPVAHDLHWHQFSRLAYPGIDSFSVSSPSFVQHVGVHSGISGRTHLIEYSSWPGRDWRYRG